MVVTGLWVFTGWFACIVHNWITSVKQCKSHNKNLQRSVTGMWKWSQVGYWPVSQEGRFHRPGTGQYIHCDWHYYLEFPRCIAGQIQNDCLDQIQDGCQGETRNVVKIRYLKIKFYQIGWARNISFYNDYFQNKPDLILKIGTSIDLLFNNHICI